MTVSTTSNRMIAIKIGIELQVTCSGLSRLLFLEVPIKEI